MTTKKMYKYMGYNGSVTTPVLLPNIDHLEMVELVADPGHYLTNGSVQRLRVTVALSDASKWTEVEGVIE